MIWRYISERLHASADHHHPLSPRLNEEFFASCRSNPCLPDFIPIHFYPHDLNEEVLHAELAAPLGLLLHRYAEYRRSSWGSLRIRVYLRDMLALEMRLLAEQGLSDKELVLTEWNRAPIRELTNNTVYKAAYLGKAIVDSMSTGIMPVPAVVDFSHFLLL
ncbi:hypothetical protein QJQ58_06525 [Paenibacillus dendritiformis]|uniref:hypothetical protein n=1 Tax=Paenibacillus dendritiformis TaxID=130049 RepID=UPI00248CB746|nr:hypothetical protein [Paenibacillus dendritiformis]WGU95912.1 hypothetical protein QJQ58_06525 [Paenibacillus dendritiformis]